ncbi:class II aminoacyl-tRNA synthetase/biotinyl protein ligase and lipoyl protein ligase like protein [Babesia gibsoni]|uniref:Class II aminoacyl-tRNA synthetase/biotinyl protein ligase and lipoyl protein ligase like protein n=1 Tax=Babesia gibsoni TaxID=33632 RepID=A0AAD8PER7_BABGI|nr:class II aminoacyl-tRNA synthetase/biotinyl protein ligase and lipoyl protein ligase like protein [Babesia gibsoni]
MRYSCRSHKIGHRRYYDRYKCGIGNPLCYKNGELLTVPESRGDTFDVPEGRNLPQLLHKAGILGKTGPGTYAQLPIGWKIITRLKRVIRVEMARIAAQECCLPIIQQDGIIKSRLSEFGSDMFKLYDRQGKLLHLSPTCEELACTFISSELSPLSKSQLPLVLYQINTKFRDEMRCSDSGMRCREFLMKDAYSFHPDAVSASLTYADFKEAYERIMNTIGIECHLRKNGDGNHVDEEFLVNINADGEPTELEVAHLFQLGTTITSEAGLMFEDAGREQKPVYMNSYGIGIQRLMYAAIAKHSDGEGLALPQVMAPYDVAVVLCELDDVVSRHFASALHRVLLEKGLHPLLDDRDMAVKQRVADLKTIGVPHLIYISHSAEAATLKPAPADVVRDIKVAAEVSNSYHLWQSEAPIKVQNGGSMCEDLMDKRVRYVWRKDGGEYTITVSELLDLLRI